MMMSRALLGVWVSLLASLLWYACSFGGLGLNPSALLGFSLSWPIGNYVGRRKGLIWSHLLLLLALLLQWTGWPPQGQARFPFIGLCVGLHRDLQAGLQLLYIFESTRRAWRPAALVSVFLSGALLVALVVWADPIPLFIKEEEHRKHLLNFALIPAGIQVGALLLCSVESPGWSAVQGGNREQAEADAKRLSLSAADVADLARKVGDIGRVKRLGVKLVVISLLIAAVNGVIRYDWTILDTLKESPTFVKSGWLINCCLTFLFIVPTWGMVLRFHSSRLSSGKFLYFGSAAALLISAAVRIGLMLLFSLIDDLAMAFGSNPIFMMISVWEVIAWVFYVIDGLLTLPLLVLLTASLFILLMELGGTRGRAAVITCPWLLVVGGGVLVLVVLGLVLFVLGLDLQGMMRDAWGWLDGVATLQFYTKWVSGLGLVVGLGYAAGRLWKGMGQFEIGGEEEEEEEEGQGVPV